MANEFTIAKDLKVELYLPNKTGAIWNLSKWDDGSNWSSAVGDGFTWTDIVATVSQATVEIGSSVENAYIGPITPNTLSLQIQSAELDPANNSYLRPNLPIKFSYRANPDTAPSTWTVLFQGYLETFGVTYDAFGNNLIDLTATSSVKKYLNKNVSSISFTNGYASASALGDLATSIGVTETQNLFTSWNYSLSADTYTNTAAAEIWANILDPGSGFFWQNPVDNSFNFIQGAYMRTAIAGGTSTTYFSATHTTAGTHYCITDLQFVFDTDRVYNSFIINSTAAPATFYTKKNQDLIELYNELRLEKEFHLDAASCQVWLDNTSIRMPGRAVTMVQTRGIRPEGQLVNLTNLQPGTVVNVAVTKPTYSIDDTVMVTKTTHTIDPDNWFVTLEVWKGL